MDKEENSEDSGDEILKVYSVGNSSTKPIRVEIQIDGKPISMEVDTGAAVSLMSQSLLVVVPRFVVQALTVPIEYVDRHVFCGLNFHGSR